MLSAHIHEFGHPLGVNPEEFHLIAGYEKDSRRWKEIDWINQYSGEVYRITTTGHHGGRGIARVKSYGDVLRKYETHPESKAADAQGEPCSRRTVGLLQRRRVRIESVYYIGKEANKLEVVDAGMVHRASDVYTEYVDAGRERKAWLREVVPQLNAMTLRELQRRTGLSRAALQAVRAGRIPTPRIARSLGPRSGQPSRARA